MKCPECVKTGQRSEFHTDGYSSSTAMGGSSTYWDEDGNQHYHDVNNHSSMWWCSLGHRFHRSGCEECPSCDRGGYHWALQPPREPEPEPTYITLSNLTFSVPKSPRECQETAGDTEGTRPVPVEDGTP